MVLGFGFLWILLMGVDSGFGQVSLELPEDQVILESFLRHTKTISEGITQEAVRKIEQPEDICWVWARYLRMPLVAYKITRDSNYLDLFVSGMATLFTRLREGPGGYLGFRGLPLPLFRDPQNPNAEIEVDISEFEIARLICDFTVLVRGEEGLRNKYQKDAQRLMEVVERHLAGPKWEERGLYVDLGPLGAIFRMPPECGNGRDNLTNPHNKLSKICRAYLALYRASGKDDYFRKAIKLGVRFKNTLRRDGERYLWNYWDPAGPWDLKPDGSGEWKHWIGPEHRGGYHALTVEMAVELYDHGVVFDAADIKRFVNTQMEICWNGDIENPVFRTTGGTEPEERQKVVIAPSLARFEPRIWEFCYGPKAAKERLLRKDSPWQGGVEAMDYLSGKYLESRFPHPTRAVYREQFLRKPENAYFMKGLGLESG